MAVFWYACRMLSAIISLSPPVMYMPVVPPYVRLIMFPSILEKVMPWSSSAFVDVVGIM